MLAFGRTLLLAPYPSKFLVCYRKLSKMAETAAAVDLDKCFEVVNELVNKAGAVS